MADRGLLLMLLNVDDKMRMYGRRETAARAEAEKAVQNGNEMAFRMARYHEAVANRARKYLVRAWLDAHTDFKRSRLRKAAQRRHEERRRIMFDTESRSACPDLSDIEIFWDGNDIGREAFS